MNGFCIGSEIYGEVFIFYTFCHKLTIVGVCVKSIFNGFLLEVRRFRISRSRVQRMDSPPHKKFKLQSTPAELLSPIAVLDDEYYDEIEEVEVYVGVVLNKSYIGNLVQRLKTMLPMPDHLAHLKRVKGDEIILAAVKDSEKESCIEAVQKLEGLQTAIKVCKVSGKSPKTKEQHRQANQIWPCNFHPSKDVEKLLTGTFFQPEQVARQYEYMELALNVAKAKGALVGAVVVNPKSGEVIATAHDERLRNPSNHAVMGVLENVAAVQREFRDTEESKNAKEKDLPYLCTGYDLYVTREPCIMCAMAMIHSRVRRVFYGYESEFGALGTKCKIHTINALNHHYLVFKNILSNECRILEKNDEICVK